MQYNVRCTLKEAHASGGTIPAGKPVFVMNAAANRDPDAFTDADTFDIDRDHTEAQHLGLGLRDSQLPRRGAGPDGKQDRAGEAARLHAPLRGELGWLQAGHDAERRGLAERPGEGVAMRWTA